MKKMVSLFTFYAMLFAATAQNPDPGMLLRKAASQRSTAWILAGAGGGLITVGWLLAVSWEHDLSNRSFSGDKLTTGGVLLVAGGAAIVSCLPFFIAAGKNKRKANLVLKNENVFYPQFNSKQRLLSLGVKINL